MNRLTFSDLISTLSVSSKINIFQSVFKLMQSFDENFIRSLVQAIGCAINVVIIRCENCVTAKIHRTTRPAHGLRFNTQLSIVRFN